jgi:hypothetical protein
MRMGNIKVQHKPSSLSSPFELLVKKDPAMANRFRFALRKWERNHRCACQM